METEGDADTGTGTGRGSQKTMCEIGVAEVESLSAFKKLILGINAPKTATIFFEDGVFFEANADKHGWFCLKLITVLEKCLKNNESFSWRENFPKSNCALCGEFRTSISSLTALIVKSLADIVDGIEENNIPHDLRVELGAFSGSLIFYRKN